MKKVKIFFTRLWFKYRLNKGDLIHVNNGHRGIGKSTMLVNLSSKKDIPIVIGKQNDWNNLKYINPNIDVLRLAKNFTLDFQGKQFPNGVLIEESVSSEMIDWLIERNIEIRGGFRSDIV